MLGQNAYGAPISGLPVSRAASRWWRQPAWIAGAWVAGAVVFSGWFAEREERKTGPHDHGRVMLVITIAFVLAPLVAGLAHRSRRVSAVAAVFAVIGWIVSALYFVSVQSSIGGGP